MQFLNDFISDHNIQSFADIPCGDAFWQFGSFKLNTIQKYFGGDVSGSVIKLNKENYADHKNKYFAQVDLTESLVPSD